MPIFATMGFNFVRDYLKHRFTAKTRHGTHSPFVYKLTDEVIYDFKPKSIYIMPETLRKKLSNDALAQANSTLARNNSRRLDQLVYRIAKDHNPVHIVELENLSAVTTAYLAASYTDAKEGEVMIREVNEVVDLLYIGSCTSKRLLNYFQAYLPRFHDGSLMMVKGIYGNAETKQAWKQIKEHERVTVTVDLFWIGLVYFRKGQAKEHFKIRF
jgi:hypothetical protein